MKRQSIWCIAAVLMGAMLVSAQAPMPGAEHKKLGIAVGTWSIEGEIKAGNHYGIPAGKINTIERVQWMPGEFFTQTFREGKMGTADIKHMLIHGYDPIAKKYKVAWYELNGGGSMIGTGTNEGNRWTWDNSGLNSAGKPFYERCTTTFVSNTSSTYKCDSSPDGKAWVLSAEGKGTKTKP